MNHGLGLTSNPNTFSNKKPSKGSYSVLRFKFQSSKYVTNSM